MKEPSQPRTESQMGMMGSLLTPSVLRQIFTIRHVAEIAAPQTYFFDRQKFWGCREGGRGRMAPGRERVGGKEGSGEVEVMGFETILLKSSYFKDTYSNH